MKKIAGGICAAKGFLASGVKAHIKSRKTDKLDVAVLMSTSPATAAGVFTTNKVKAACVTLSMEAVKQPLQAIIMNSGNANCCTGEQGMQDAQAMQAAAAEGLKIPMSAVAVASTGVIGERLPMDRMLNGIVEVCATLSPQGGEDAASAIMTTDTFRKEYALEVFIGGKSVILGGMAKGSGMIHPNMATTLGFVSTDVNISNEALQLALKKANDNSFNMISVDGDTSTNDMILVLANGQAQNNRIEVGSDDFQLFLDSLQTVLIALAKMVIKDGEGATKMFEVNVIGAASELEARKAARAVSSSSLVKSAIFGNDANWGRILCALGYSGAEFDPALVDLYIGTVPVMRKGANLPFDEVEATKVLSQNEMVITACLHSGRSDAKAWGCDLTYDYVKINGSYRT
jgi:glutamate N-acetyltransferase/amino-acid N-acetyltransferase